MLSLKIKRKAAKNPKMKIGDPVPSPTTIKASANHMARSAHQAASKNSIGDAGLFVPPPNPPPAAPLPSEPLFTKHRATLFILANEDDEGRADFLEMMPDGERKIIEGLMDKVYAVMERRGTEMAHAMAIGKEPNYADVTELQNKDGENRDKRAASETWMLPPPFSATPRRITDPSVLPSTPTPPRPYAGGSLQKHEKHKYTPKQGEGLVEDVDDEGAWVTVNDMGHYAALVSRSAFASLTQPVHRTSNGGRFSGSSKAKDKNSSPIKLLAENSNSVNTNFQDIVDDFIAQETGLLRYRNKLSIVFDSRRAENDTLVNSYMADPENQSMYGKLSTHITPIIRVNSSDEIKDEIFTGKDGALQTKEEPSDFKISASAPGRLTRSDTIVFHQQFLEENQTVGALLLPFRPAAPPPVEEDEEEDPETPRRVPTSFVGGMKRVDTMSNLHANREDSVGDLYSNADDITSPVPFKATIAAGNKARNRRLGHSQQEIEEIEELKWQAGVQDGWKANQRHSVWELGQQAVVSKRLEEEATKRERLVTPDKERKKNDLKDEIKRMLNVTEQHIKQFQEEANQHRRSLEEIDREDYSPPKDDDQSPRPMGKQGSEIYLHRDTLTQFSKDSLYSSSDMPTPTHTRTRSMVRFASMANLFSSPNHRSSPLAQPPLNAMANMSISNFAETTSTGKYLNGFPIPVVGKKSHQFRSPPKVAHPGSDDNVPSSPTNRFGTIGRIGKWKDSLRSGREMSFSSVKEADEIDRNADWGRARVPKKMEHSQSLMALFHEPPNMPTGAVPKQGLSQSEFAPGMNLKDESGIFSLGRGKGHKRSASEQSKLKKLYEDQINDQGVYSTPTINRGGDVAPPAPVYMRMYAFGVQRETTSQRLDYHQHRFGQSVVELNNAMKDENPGENADDQFFPSPPSFNSETFSNTPPTRNPDRYKSPNGVISSTKKALGLGGAKSAPLFDKTFAGPESKAVASTTPSGTPSRCSRLVIPGFAPPLSSSSPLSRVVSAPESPEEAVKKSGRSFLPNSRTIPKSLVGYSKITRKDPAPIDRSPERMPYIEGSGSLMRLNSMMKMNAPDDEEEKRFVRYAKKALVFADGKRKSRYE